MNLDNAIVYDVEVLPNYASLYAERLHSDDGWYFEICPWNNQSFQLLEFLNSCNSDQIPMIGFNNLGYDIHIIDFIWRNIGASNEAIYQKSQQVIGALIKPMIWESDRLAPQVDLFKINHFDNKAKSTSLKALQVNMRSELVLESELPFDQPITEAQAVQIIKPYNIHDVRETKRFAHYNKPALDFRIGLGDKVDGDAINFNDTKIGAKILEKRLGEALCYDRSSGRREPRRTMHNRIALRDIIFPYIQFSNPEFVRIHQWMLDQVLTPADLEDAEGPIQTKGVFKGVVAHVGGIEFAFGTGGIHGSVLSRVYRAGDGWLIRDIDVASLYPNIAIKNLLAPAHLGAAFVQEYSALPEERKAYQKQFGKKCVPANALKLASNGTYGNLNNQYSPFYDPLVAMTITINGQLMLCMLAEWLMTVPTFEIIQINTDGITYRIHHTMEPFAAEICRKWEAWTCLTLEDADYSRMWIRDVNAYVAESLDGSLKQKGAYWHPDPKRYAESISESQPPAWHKDLGASVIQQAAVAHMVHGQSLESFIRHHKDPFDFVLRAKVDRSSRLMLGDRQLQRVSRYYVSTDGAPLRKISPPTQGNQVGDFKRATKVPESLWQSVTAELVAAGRAGEWDSRIHTKNKSRYEMREMSFEAGWLVSECNDISKFKFDNINFAYYVAEAQKLVING